MAKSLRLLKFDTAHPEGYLQHLQRQCAAELAPMDYEEYYRWLMGLRVGMSDFLTHPMNQAGWVTREFLPKDRLLMRKLAESGEVKGIGLSGRFRFGAQHALSLSLLDIVCLRWGRRRDLERRYWFMRRYIESYKPDVIFVREPAHIDGEFFDRFRDRCALVALIGCNTNHAQHWDPHRYDAVFTLTGEYHRFFKIQGLNSHIFDYGVDERVISEVSGLPKKFDCTFVGFLGQATQSRKSELLERVAAAVDFKWWGVKGPDMGKYPALERSWQGETAGLEMFQIYRQSKIVLNDYVDMAGGTNVNIRTKEVLGVGSMLLTREATNITHLEQEGALVIFKNADDCVSKLRHYLADETSREDIASKGLATALKKFNYRDSACQVMDVIADAHDRKKIRLKPWV
jgi:hypothetical protein